MNNYRRAIISTCTAGVVLLSGGFSQSANLQSSQRNYESSPRLTTITSESQPQARTASQLNQFLANDSQAQWISFSHFSFHSLVDRGWEITQQGRDRVEFTKSFDGGTCIVMAFEQNVLDSEFRQSSASEVADFFRERERQGMIQMGVNQGLYELEDVIMGEEDINGNHFFTMKYKTIYETITGSAVMNNGLYLFFPQIEDNEFFFGTVYAEGPERQGSLTTTCQTDFQDLLSSIGSVTAPTY